jgi:UDP-N-acetylmuramyl pentapeptide phosphotransferase/UDP-N-acetylglucosamine-1-phosphate transferase
MMCSSSRASKRQFNRTREAARQPHRPSGGFSFTLGGRAFQLGGKFQLLFERLQISAQALGRLIALLSVFPHGLADDVLQLSRSIRHQFFERQRLFVEQRAEHVGRCFARERQPAGQHLLDDDA